ncbi:ankyrin repeat-containing protein At5g02620-like [Cryptomeria japonica]|uniref:ankyrin repeat-containing protein At5g02620-like n=1 Tax=Cryptomeria japonica TaxID=3369 RepID=UPI0027DA7434|nr:ankyrin repeat-containing protein At5g02620-like [Cryptomeria japonica]
MEDKSGQPSEGIDRDAYIAAVHPGTEIEFSEHKDALKSTTFGGANNLLHLAASVGNLQVVQQLLKLNPPLVKETNARGITALHLAAQGGFSDVVKALLQQPQSGVDVRNKLNETALFKAYESDDLATVKALFDACPSSLRQKTSEERTCLYVAITRGDSDHSLFQDLVGRILKLPYAKDLIHEKYKDGDTALHIAVGRNDVHIIKRLLEIEPQLCYYVNNNKESPLCIAAKLGHLEALKVLIKTRPDAIEIPNSCGMNVLHLAAQVRQVRIVDYLRETVALSELVNRGLDKPPKKKPLQSGKRKNPAGKKYQFSKITKGDTPLHRYQFSKITKGDTPLHIAARKKHFNMVKSLLGIRG